MRRARARLQIWVSWRKRNLFDLEWLAEERRKGEDLLRERLRHEADHKRRTSIYQQRMQGTREQRRTLFGQVSQPAGDVSHKPGGRLPLLSARPAVSLATLKRAATNFAAW